MTFFDTVKGTVNTAADTISNVTQEVTTIKNKDYETIAETV